MVLYYFPAMSAGSKERTVMAIENKILKELLEGEFKGLLPRPKVQWVEFVYGNCLNIPGGFVARAFYDGNIVMLNPKIKKILRKAPVFLREVLRHELAHLKTGKEEEDKEFADFIRRNDIAVSLQHDSGVLSICKGGTYKKNKHGKVVAVKNYKVTDICMDLAGGK